eukprot:gnl/TRDRNA2_/TRDRNA2_167556_c2_seq1.p1 gnl/TRDRNA2_/TRDRNA2_167556_c2~~gnl/TRDRNA2_/TRDRNA2_167556_c2_seq1.p1  ORF type:complete len:468 (-),score=86.50 gnl/TRDRNA2_/TRDRNA2_167556_c2_seq1:96-1499(-)
MVVAASSAGKLASAPAAGTSPAATARLPLATRQGPSDSDEPTPKTPAKRHFPKHLMETYDVQSVVGEGMSSIVCRCVHRATGKVRAVKKIDTGQFSPRDIAQEIALMRLLRHDNVVKCYDVFLEANFVNIVVDMFAGGDLMDGLFNHRQAYGPIPDGQLAYITNQMVAAISHVHSLKIVHRDVKGENFLLDRRNIGDPNCRVALTDFGTAVRLEPGMRLHDQCGTASFWSPEMWSADYDWAVDVWAVGVTAFILQAGNLPFKGKEDVCGTKGLPKPWGASPLFMQFVSACLSKDGRKRPKAAELSQYSWLTTPSTWVPPETWTSFAISGVVAAIETIGSCAVDCLSLTLSGLGQLLKDADADARKTPPADGKLRSHGQPFGGHSGESIKSGEVLCEELMLQGCKPSGDGVLACWEEGEDRVQMPTQAPRAAEVPPPTDCIKALDPFEAVAEARRCAITESRKPGVNR